MLVHSSSFAVADDVVPRKNDGLFKRYEKNGGIWDGTGGDRQLIETYEDFDALDKDARVFSAGGYEIIRHAPVFLHGERRPWGVLVDFENLRTLFESDTCLHYARAGPPSPHYYAYPQAGLVTAGHLQANSLISNFYPLVEEVNRKVLGRCYVRNSEGLEEELRSEAPNWPIYGISCQIYNAVMHHTRGIGSQHHEVTRGTVSAALGSGCVRKTAELEKARKLRTATAHGLPHEDYELKASNPAISKDLRLENVYWVDFDKVAEVDRNGG